MTSIFGDDSAIYRYVDLLAGEGVLRGLIGPREAARVWDRHIFNCVAAATAVPIGATVADIGSGAGLPGLVLALARPDLRVTLVESLLRRTAFLDEVVQELSLPHVTVVRARAEDVRDRFDVVTSRAVAPLAKLAAWSLPLCRPGGVMLALKGASAADELGTAQADLRRMGVTSARVEEYDVGVDPPTRVIRIESPRHPTTGRTDRS